MFGCIRSHGRSEENQEHLQIPPGCSGRETLEILALAGASKVEVLEAAVDLGCPVEELTQLTLSLSSAGPASARQNEVDRAWSLAREAFSRGQGLEEVLRRILGPDDPLDSILGSSLGLERRKVAKLLGLPESFAQGMEPHGAELRKVDLEALFPGRRRFVSSGFLNLIDCQGPQVEAAVGGYTLGARGHLSLSACKGLGTIHRLGLKERGTLEIERCPGLRAIEQVNGVRKASLSECPDLRTLPPWEEGLGSMDLKACPRLGSLDFQGADGLRLDLRNVGLRGRFTLPRHPYQVTLVELPFLEVLEGRTRVSENLRIAGCRSLVRLPEGLYVGMDLQIEDCPRLESLPESLASAHHVYIRGCPRLRLTSAQKARWNIRVEP